MNGDMKMREALPIRGREAGVMLIEALIAWLLQSQPAFQRVFPKPTGTARFKAFRSL